MTESNKHPPGPSPPDEQEGQLPEEALDEQIVDLPSREALSIVDPGVFGVGIPSPLGRTADAPPADTSSAEPPEPAT